MWSNFFCFFLSLFSSLFHLSSSQTKKKGRKKNSSLKKNDSPKALSFCVSALKTAPHRARMLRRRALTFAERALTNSSSRRPRTGTATQKRGMGTCKSIVRGVVQPLFVFFLWSSSSSSSSSSRELFVLTSSSSSFSTSRARVRSNATISRAAGGEGGVTHEGLTIHPASPVHKFLGTAMGGLMWFWVMYRFYHDGETLIYGHEPHFLHDDHHDDDHQEDDHNKKH